MSDMMATVDARERLIFALDVPTVEAAQHMLDRVDKGVKFVKIGLELYTATGPDFIRQVLARGKHVFLDLKFLDIEETVRRATRRVAELGISFLTIHANRKALRAAVEARGDARLKLLAVTVLTNFDAHDLRDMGIQWSVEDLVAARARLAMDCGCDGVIASGAEAAAIREQVSRTCLIVTPGIRPAGKGFDEHARATSPSQAIQAGADYLVVGRPIRDAADPLEACETIISEMQKAFDARV